MLTANTSLFDKIICYITLYYTIKIFSISIFTFSNIIGVGGINFDQYVSVST